MSAADPATVVAKFIRLLDAPNESEAQAAFRQLRAYCVKHQFRLIDLQIGSVPVRIQLNMTSNDDSTRRTISIIEEQQSKTQDYCAFLERQVDDLTRRLAEAEARPRRKKRKKVMT